jgi:hypothetical protein
MGKVIFWHTYLINEYKLVVQEQLMKLITSGLYNEVDKIYVGIISPSEENTNWFINLLSSYPKFAFKLHNTNEAEKCTMRDVADFCKENDAYVMYFHTKAVSNTGYNNTLWRWSMDYNLMYRHKECIELFTKPKVLRVEDEIVSDKIINKILPKVEKDKKEEKPKEIVFNQPKRNSIDHSKYVYWCNPHTSINIGKLGSSQAWRNEKPTKSYY